MRTSRSLALRAVVLAAALLLALLHPGAPSGSARAEDPKPPAPAAPAAPLASPEAPAAAAASAGVPPALVPPVVPAAGERLPSPLQGEVRLPAAEGWRAALVLDNEGVGVWAVAEGKVFPHYGCPEVLALDDRGRLTVLVGYSGRWTPGRTIDEGVWLAGLVQGDLDPRVPGPEVYAGSQRGNLFQVLAWPDGGLENRRVAHVEGRAVNALVAADLDPSTPGDELLLFAWPGGLFRADPDGPAGTFTLRTLLGSAPLVRDAVVLPAREGAPREVACVSRDGRLDLLTLGKDGPRLQLVHREAMGLGRVALRSPAPRAAPGAGPAPAAAALDTTALDTTVLYTVLYTTVDDGRVLRHERRPDGTWGTGTIYLGPIGPRGLVAGRFHADPSVESVALFGYSGRVEVLSRAPGKPWTAEVVYRDADKGHFLATCEVDGRNATDEILACGFGGRIVLISRPPGCGKDALGTSED